MRGGFLKRQQSVGIDSVRFFLLVNTIKYGDLVQMLQRPTLH